MIAALSVPEHCLSFYFVCDDKIQISCGERGGSVVECRTPEREVRGSRPTAAVLCPWARHFTPRKYWLITQEAMAPSWHDWKIVDWDVKPQHNQISCTVWLRKMENLAMTFYYLWITETLWLLGGGGGGGTAPQSPQKPPPPLNINYITTSHFLTTQPAVGCWLGKKGLYFDRLLKLLNCQIFSQLVFGIKGCSSITGFISNIFRLLCIALWHYVRG